ncbi:MAG: endonuclease III [Candidatus Aenigmarchaeota archaeon]|nr:endonuclease III [Candidatus Aenigmarchaeota archaeon]
MDLKKALRQLEMLEKYSSGMRLAAERWDAPWKTLIAIILSARSRDEKTIEVAIDLFKKYPNIGKLANAKLGDIENSIRQINFYKTKARNVLGCTKVLVKNYNGNPPHDMDKLLELPGVGRKTANVFLSESGKDAIGVDTHVSYVSRKLGWTENTNPEKIETDLKRLFPQKYWRKINPILVRFGKSYTSEKRKNVILEKIKRM